MQLSTRNILFLYIGSLMGAGFASGTEMWQFFGVFGKVGIFGVLLSTAVFILFGYLCAYNARAMGTGSMAKMIVPADSPRWEAVISGVMFLFLLMAYFSTLAAGGALTEEQFGIPHGIGSFILMLLVGFTAISGFHTVAGRLRKLTPVLVMGTLLVGLAMVIRYWGELAGGGAEATPQSVSPVAGNWALASVAFVAYNMSTGAIPMLGNCALFAKNKKSALRGAVLGGLGLGLCCCILYLTTLTDPVASASTSLPMLAFCQKISPALQLVYALFLIIAVFSTATSCLFGLSTAIPPSRYKVALVWAAALLGYGMSLFGFGNLVAFLYPIGGYFSVVILAGIAVNFVRLKKGIRRLPGNSGLWKEEGE